MEVKRQLTPLLRMETPHAAGSSSQLQRDDPLWRIGRAFIGPNSPEMRQNKEPRINEASSYMPDNQAVFPRNEHLLETETKEENVWLNKEEFGLDGMNSDDSTLELIVDMEADENEEEDRRSSRDRTDNKVVTDKNLGYDMKEVSGSRGKCECEKCRIKPLFLTKLSNKGSEKRQNSEQVMRFPWERRRPLEMQEKEEASFIPLVQNNEPEWRITNPFADLGDSIKMTRVSTATASIAGMPPVEAEMSYDIPVPITGESYGKEGVIGGIPLGRGNNITLSTNTEGGGRIRREFTDAQREAITTSAAREQARRLRSNAVRNRTRTMSKLLSELEYLLPYERTPGRKISHTEILTICREMIKMLVNRDRRRSGLREPFAVIDKECLKTMIYKPWPLRFF